MIEELIKQRQLREKDMNKFIQDEENQESSIAGKLHVFRFKTPHEGGPKLGIQHITKAVANRFIETGLPTSSLTTRPE
ncbi:hypothetical protein Mapa_008159 [Marchantia paleacea]|nr:hypothetical protein Mapa_008159 [Marchantia paleacea]